MQIENILKGEVGVDGCGLVSTTYVQNPVLPMGVVPISDLRKFIVSHAHRDHIPSREDLVLYVPEPAIVPVKNIYEKVGLKVKAITLEAKLRETFHFGADRAGRIIHIPTHCCLFDDFVYIPESAEQRKLIKEYGECYDIGIVCRTPRKDSIERPLCEEEIPENWYFLNNRCFGQPSSRVIPKCVPALVDEVMLKRDGRVQKLYI